MEPGEQRSRGASLRVAVSDAQGRTIERALSRWLSRVAPRRARGTVSIALVSDRLVRVLNQRYRGIDRPTDVLSFPAVNWPQSAQNKASALPASSAAKFLGDIVIARGVARRQARQAGHSEATELKVLALHGLLHLLGYDHERDNGAMARLERRLRRMGGLREGLIERR
jgi:probable rRNA maturation factor